MPGSVPDDRPDLAAAVDLAAIRRAAALLAGHILRTPVIAAPRLSAASGARVSLKLENLQHTGSFKVRGAGVKLLSLDEAGRRRGVVAASAGNHAQGVAFHARALGVRAVIVMPEGTPFAKIAATQHFGAEIVLKGGSVADAASHAARLAAQEGLVLIPPFDDPLIVAGQGTVGLEIADQCPEVEIVIVPVGGGGLLAGIALALSETAPECAVYGVEVSAYPSLARSFGHDVPDRAGPTLAEGIAVDRAGALPTALARRLVKDVLLVSEREVELALERLLIEDKILSEGAAAASVAALLARPDLFRGRRVCLVISGGNIDARVVSTILLRGLYRSGRMVRLRVETSDRPGVLARIAGIIAEAGGNIVEVYHHRLFHDVPIKGADLDLVIEGRGRDHAEAMAGSIRAAGFPAVLLDTSGDDGHL